MKILMQNFAHLLGPSSSASCYQILFFGGRGWIPMSGGEGFLIQIHIIILKLNGGDLDFICLF